MITILQPTVAQLLDFRNLPVNIADHAKVRAEYETQGIRQRT